MKRTIDLNLDAGESLERLRNGYEARLYDLVSSVSIACGGHTGDEKSMRLAVRHANERGLLIGAHPSYVDRENFGRARLFIEPRVLTDTLIQQISALTEICDEEGARLTHVKPHGALYHAAAESEETALALIESVIAVDPELAIMGYAGSDLKRWSEDKGLRFIGEAFVDRRYEMDGRLRARALPDAMIENDQEAARQALNIVVDEKVKAAEGSWIRLNAETLCIHGDSATALESATAVRAALEKAGVFIQPYEVKLGETQ